MNISQCGLSVIPNSILELTNIEHLDLSHNEISIVPKIEFMLSLRKIILCHNQILSIPEDYKFPPELQMFDIRYKVFPANIFSPAKN